MAPFLVRKPKSSKASHHYDGRQGAIIVLQRILKQGESLSVALPAVLPSIMPEKDRAFAQDLVYGVLRWRWTLEALVQRLLSKPLKARDFDLQCLLSIALYQLLHSREPDYGVVDGAVRTCSVLQKKWASGLVNGVLRNFLRQREAFLSDLESDEIALYSHPQWLIEQIKSDWPQHWQRILQANNQRPPMSLRVNIQRIPLKGYAEQLAQAGIASHVIDGLDSGLMLEKPVDVSKLPGFAEGLVSVQDAAAQHAAGFLNLRPGQRVLDACAAPGGKTAHLIETEPGLAEVVAVDISADRLKLVEQNLKRLDLAATLRQGDAALPNTWHDGAPFDRILLDVPCSATGVIRRHPDIKSLRRPEDIAALVEIQGNIIEAIWPLLKKGGELLYATCSILKRENQQQIADFVQRNDDARHLPIEDCRGEAMDYGCQFLPGDSDMDGFYFARLVRISHPRL